MSESVIDIDHFKEFIKRRARETWNERASPYYLSFVATDLKKQGVDYRELVAPLKLSQWAASNEVPETILITHPTQRAKIGFVPSDSGFAFSSEPTVEVDHSRERRPGRGRALSQFVQTLSNLPEDSIDGLSVPAKTLIALLKQ